MAQTELLLEQRVDFDPSQEVDAFARQVPAKWAIVLLADAAGQPVQLLSVKNLRACLKRRLGKPDPAEGPSRKVDYAQIVRQIRWRRVDSGFEADWVYLETARVLFPKSYRGMVGFRPAWFIYVNPETAFPRYIKTIDLSPRPGHLLGPLEDKHAAARLIERVEDAFDLCRYYQILVQAPNGNACAYKGMGKCPAPCDGSISMEQYRRLMELSLTALLDPKDVVREHTRRMQQAAAELRFELAQKIKTYVQQLTEMSIGPFRHVRLIGDMVFVSLQRGPLTDTATVFLITPGQIQPIATVLSEPARPGELLRTLLTLAEDRVPERGGDEQSAVRGVDEQGAERIGIVSHYLFSPKSGPQSAGVFLPLADISESALAKAYRDIRKQKPLAEVEGEGVVKELAGMGEKPE